MVLRNSFRQAKCSEQSVNDVFSDINIYDDDIRLLQRRFVSPISDGGISFYKYYLMDTLTVDKDTCVHLTFVPQNVSRLWIYRPFVCTKRFYLCRKKSHHESAEENRSKFCGEP